MSVKINDYLNFREKDMTIFVEKKKKNSCIINQKKLGLKGRLLQSLVQNQLHMIFVI